MKIVTHNLTENDLAKNDITQNDLSLNFVPDPPLPALSRSAIHVWEFPLLSSESTFAGLAKLLSPDEHARASRLHFEKDARRFTVARASARVILAGYTLSPARGLKFLYSEQGKPRLDDDTREIRFNISHSGDLALLAVALGREVGVDVEAIREDVETDKLGERFFSAGERESLRALPPAKRVLAFFRCWTCKEAFLKAQGVGLSRELGSFDVEVDPAQPARLISSRPNSDEAKRWWLHDVETPPQYAAAVAIEGSVNEMRILRRRPDSSR